MTDVAQTAIALTPSTLLNQSGNFTNFAVDSTTDGVAAIFEIPETATITTVSVRQGTVTGTAPTYVIGFMSKSPDGTPDGTYLGGGSPQSGTFTPTAGDDSTVISITLDNSYSAVRGATACLVIQYSSGTVDGSNNCSFTYVNNTSDSQGYFGLPYAATQASGTWTRQDDLPCMGMGDGTSIWGFPLVSRSTVTVADDLTPDAAGQAFTAPADIFTSFNIRGVSVQMDLNAAQDTDEVSVSIWEDTTLRQTATFTSDASGTNLELYIFQFNGTLYDFTPGTEYIIRFYSSTTATDIRFELYSFTSEAALKGNYLYSGGWKLGYTTRKDTDAWAAVDYAKCLKGITLYLSDITAPAGGGGLLVHPGTSGGMRG